MIHLVFLIISSTLSLKNIAQITNRFFWPIFLKCFDPCIIMVGRGFKGFVTETCNQNEFYTTCMPLLTHQYLPPYSVALLLPSYMSTKTPLILLSTCQRHTIWHNRQTLSHQWVGYGITHVPNHQLVCPTIYKAISIAQHNPSIKIIIILHFNYPPKKKGSLYKNDQE